MNPIERSRDTLLVTPDFKVHTGTVDIPTGSLYMVHLDVFRWSKDVLKQLLFEWSFLRPTLPNIVFCMPNNPGRKFNNFVSHFGWNFIADIPCDDGLLRPIYAHFKEQ